MADDKIIQPYLYIVSSIVVLISEIEEKKQYFTRVENSKVYNFTTFKHFIVFYIKGTLRLLTLNFIKIVTKSIMLNQIHNLMHSHKHFFNIEKIITMKTKSKCKGLFYYYCSTTYEFKNEKKKLNTFCNATFHSKNHINIRWLLVKVV